MVRFVLAISAGAISSIFADLASAQDKKQVEVASVVTSAQFIHSAPAISFLGGSPVTLYKINDQYFFIPNPVADWAAFSVGASELCAGVSGETQVSIPLTILMLEESTRAELAASAGTTPDRIIPVPSYGYSIFYRLDGGEPIALYSTITTSALLEGEQIANDFYIPRTKKVSFPTTCDSISRILDRGEIDVRFHVQGQTFQKSAFSAEVLLRDVLNARIDAERAAEEVNRTRLTTSGSSSGGMFSMGPVSFGKSKSRTSTETDVQRYRVIDAEWIQSVVNEASTSVDIQKICADSAACADGAVEKVLTKFLEGYVEQAQARIDAQADGSLALSIDGIPKEVEVDISNSVKQQLDSLLKSLSEQESEIEFEGVKAKGKKVDDNTIQINGTTEWSLTEKGWIPTSFTVDIINETSLRKNVSVKYSSALLGSITKVSVLGGQAVPSDAASVRGSVSPTVIERIDALEKRKLVCEVFENSADRRSQSDPGRSHMSVSSTVPEGFEVTGGGCETFDHREASWVMVSKGTLSDDRRSWVCVTNPVPNFATSYILRAKAIGCRAQ